MLRGTTERGKRGSTFHFFDKTQSGTKAFNELKSDYSVMLPRLRFIKTDAEGYDLYILRSIEQVIREYLPVIKSEIFKRTDQKYRQEMLTFFESLDYTVFKLNREPVERGERLSRDNLGRADLAAGNHYDILALPNKRVHRTR